MSLDLKVNFTPSHNLDFPSLDDWFVQVASVSLIAIFEDPWLD